MQLGRVETAGATMRTEPAPVTRLTLVSSLESGDWSVELPRPLFLRRGEHVWVEDTTVCVRGVDGQVVRHAGKGAWVCGRLI